MPKFEHDIFISDAHIDNESMYGSEHGWIALLHKRLEIRLAQLLGRESRIWRDSRLTRTDPFPSGGARSLPLPVPYRSRPVHAFATRSKKMNSFSDKGKAISVRLEL